MCGLVGMAGNLNSTHSKMFRDMLVFDYVRGVDSTGVAMLGIAPSADVEVEKAIGSPGNLWEWGTSPLFNDRGFSKSAKKLMIGHNRAATIGVVNTENAHPFQYGSVTGAHNGSLRDWYDLEGYAHLDVDSKAIFNTINLKGIDHCWKNFSGAAALVYYDAETKLLNIIRNSERPLFIAHSEKSDAIFWASEPWMIIVAAERHKIKLKTGEKNDKPHVWQPRENWLHTYKPETMSCELQESRELEKKSYPQRSSSSGTNGHGWHNPQTPRPNHFKGGATINNTWAKGYSKAEKEVVGTKFRMTGMVVPFGNGPSTYYIQGETEAGELVHIFPSTESERHMWNTRNEAIKDGELWFKMNSRPRIAYLMKAKQPAFHAYRIGSAGVVRLNGADIPSYKTKLEKLFNKPLEPTTSEAENIYQIEDFSQWFQVYNGRVTKNRWQEIMAATRCKGCCHSCNNPLNIDQHQELNWINHKVVLCPTCGVDSEIVSQLHSMGAK